MPYLGILLFGSSLIYGFTSTTNFEILNLLLSYNLFNGNELSIGISMGLILITIGFLFKISAAPFHMWAPECLSRCTNDSNCFFCSSS